MIKKILFSFFRQFLFWIVFFNFTRLVFVVYHLRLILVEKIPLSEILLIPLNAFHLDLATACYMMLIPFLILLVQSVYSPKWINWINKVYTAILCFAYALTAAGEMGIYSEWKTKLTYKVIKYLSHPSEIYNSSETGIFYLLLLLFLFMFLSGYIAYLKFFAVEIIREKRNIWFSIIFFLVTPPLMFIGLRGGVQQIPINQSESFFSKYNIVNVTAVNNFFNLYISIFENLPNFNHDPYVFMNQAKAKNLIREIYTVKKDTTISILKTPKPNIVILIMESWSADLMEDLGGEPGITPEFKKLERNGILFDQIYAPGSRSEQGMACIFSGFPAHPVSSITVQPDKYVKLPSLPKTLQKDGYSTSFYFGGQLIYGNIKSYIYFNEFDKIMEGSDFPSSIPRGKLGIHDEYTLGYQLDELGKQKQPFFSALFTVSTHSPWDQPFKKPLAWGDNEHEYINAAYYTDHCLGEYFEKASQQPWFNNTLFIIVADHSHNSYRNWHPQSKEYHKIPLLFYGNVIRDEFRGKRWNKLGNQQDIAATLLAQLGIDHKKFSWSKDLFNPYTADFAYYSTEDGAGWIRPNAYFSFDAGPNYYHFLEIPPEIKDSILREGKAFLQGVFGEYLGD
ncbi:MAG: sulfatase-like hydrolase/transferase [Bacteroidetes bacterium]|nr:sulfatase-like hydrolase/transferase [Bacteroidota bacterium]